MNTNLFPSAYILPESSLKNKLFQLWERVQVSLLWAWAYSKHLYGLGVEFISSFYQKHPTVSYMMVGLATFCIIKCVGKWYKKSKERMGVRKEKSSDDELESTFQSKEERNSNSCEESLLSLKLPLDEILESENEDDEDRIFFEVIKNYRGA